MADIFGSGNRKDKWVKKATEWINYLFNHKSDTLVAGQNITLTPDSTNHTVTIDSTASGGASSLADLTDTNIDNPTDGQALVYDDGEWVNAPLPSAPVTDVEVDGTSVVNASGVAEIDLTDYAKSADLAEVATSGSYNDLDDTPTLGTAAAKDYTSSVTQSSTDLVTSGAVWTAIDNLPEPMVFQGTLGTGGTITTLPTASTDNIGYTYKVITAGTYAGQSAKVGDVFVSNGTEWVLIPAGDTDSDTWRAIKVNGTQLLGSAISTGAVNFKSGTNAQVNGSGNDVSVDVDTTFTEASTRTNIASGDSIKTILGKIKKFFTDLKAVAFSGSYNDLNNKPTIPTVGNGTITITQNGTSVGDFSMNQSGDETIALTDEKVKITSTDPASLTTYYPTWVNSSGTKGENINGGFSYRTRQGTTEQVGYAIITAGNATASGTDGNKRGYLRLYNGGTYYTDVIFDDSATANRTMYIPNASGTLINTGNFFTETGYLKAVRSIVTCENANSFEAGWRRFAKVSVGSYGTAILAFRGGWSNNAPYVGAVLLTVRNNEAKLRILDGFGQPNNVHQKLRAVRISANNFYLEMYRSATSNANSAQYCDIIPLGGNASAWTVSETSSTPPINNNATGAYDYEISLMDEQFMPYQTNTGYIGTADKAWKEGYINNLHGDVDGSATKLTKTETVLQTNQVPYVSRASLSPEGFSGYIREKIVGGSVGWNQNIYNGNFVDTSKWVFASTSTVSASNNVLTLTANAAGSPLSAYPEATYRKTWQVRHKILATLDAKTSTSGLAISASLAYGTVTKNKIKINFSLTSSWQTISNIVNITEATDGIRIAHSNSSAVAVGDTYQVRNVYAVDLTILFGSAIADYIYSLESSTAGAGVSLLRSLGFFTEPYYAQDNGSIQNVCVKEKKITGKNLFDASTATTKRYIKANGEISNDDNWSASDYVSVKPSTNYVLSGVTNLGTVAHHAYYDNSKAFISSILSTNYAFTTPANCAYVRLSMRNNTPTTVQLEQGTTATAYEPYHVDTIPLSATDLRGIPMLDSNNNIYFDGDEYSSDGKIKRKYKSVNLGTLTWTRSTSYTNPFFYVTISDSKANGNVMCANYTAITNYNASDFGANAQNKQCCHSSNTTQIFIRDDAYTDAATFKTAMSGVYLVYELAEPTEETALVYQNPQYAKDGTEEFVDGLTRDMIVPIGHVTEYMGTTTGEYQFMPTMPVDGNENLLVSDGHDTVWKNKLSEFSIGTLKVDTLEYGVIKGEWRLFGSSYTADFNNSGYGITVGTGISKNADFKFIVTYSYGSGLNYRHVVTVLGEDFENNGDYVTVLIIPVSSSVLGVPFASLEIKRVSDARVEFDAIVPNTSFSFTFTVYIRGNS